MLHPDDAKRTITQWKECARTGGTWDKHLKGRHELKVIDIYQNPVLAKGEQIMAVPTLIMK